MSAADWLAIVLVAVMTMTVAAAVVDAEHTVHASDDAADTGSDCPADEIHEHVERFEAIFARLGLDDDALDRIWYRNAAEVYGFEEATWAGE